MHAQWSELSCITLQVKKIALVFQLQASTVYLVREFENIAVFPHEASGRFNHSLIDLSAVYAGEDCRPATPRAATTTPGSSVPSTLFGAYMEPTLSHSVPSASTKVISRKSNSVRKTVSCLSKSNNG